MKQKNIRNWILSFLLASTIGSLQAQTADTLIVDTCAVDTIVELPWPQNLQARLDTLTQAPLLGHTQLGMMVYDLTADSTLYTYGSKQILRPASTMKLLTSISALDQLGSKYQFRTSLYYTGEVQDSVLNGDLYCVGGMDPLFDSNDMEAFAESVKALGIHTLKGNIVAVVNFKDQDLLGEGWCWDDDNPSLTPLLIDGKDEFISRFTQQLDRDSVFVDAPFTYGSLPKEALLLCQRSHSLQDVLIPMMKDSNNLYAESMFYQLGAATGAQPAKASHARNAIKRTLAKAGITGSHYKIADGSGLSLYNYVTPELLTKLLIYAYRKSSIYRDLYVSLPIAGEDGTLKKRMKDTPAQINVRAKTGTVTGVSALAGYAVATNNHILVFAIINQGIMKSDYGRNFQDKVCAALCK
jgi:D-alanyl-D-alanine carboxypeptidase/D-alanyl-D-alanine-endopeptidase (penicillin-binding protein 4)